MTRPLTLSLAAAVLAVSTAASLDGRSPASPAAARIVAIGDVHGGGDAFVSILTRAGLIDAQRRWAGGKTILVQTGDTTDRGPDVRAILDLLMALEKEASDAGGRVQVILGNHEMMNFVGDLRDVSPDAIAAFGGEAAYRAALGKDGRYGKWLRSKPVLAEIDDTVFMHAGIDLEFSKESLAALNARAQREVAEWDAGFRWLVDRKLVQPTTPFAEVVGAARAEIERMNALAETAREKLPPDAPKIASLLLPVANIASSSLFHPQGTLWFRGFATWSNEEGMAKMAAVLKHHGVKRFVTGHTVQPKGQITARFADALFLIDTGMLNGKFWPGGRPSALEILPTGVNLLYVQ